MCDVDMQALFESERKTTRALQQEIANLRTLQAPTIAAVQLASENEWLRKELTKAKSRIASLEYVLGNASAPAVVRPHNWQPEEGSHVQRCTTCGLRTTSPDTVEATCAEYQRMQAPRRRGRHPSTETAHA